MIRRKKKYLFLSLALAMGIGTGLLSGCSNSKVVEDNSSEKEAITEETESSTKQLAKARTVITTDGEVDDMNSVIRFMLYANEVDLEGIVLTSSVYHYAGDKAAGIEPFRWTGIKWLDEFIFLKELFLDDDDSPLYVQTWGGTNTTARALKAIEDEYKNTDKWEEIQDKVYNKLVVYIILDQDDSYSDYIAKSWPNLKIINDSSSFWRFAYLWKETPEELNRLLQGDWLYDNIKFNHGPLLSRYALIADGNYIEGELEEEQRGTDAYLENNPQYNKYDFISEGDSPSFFYLINNGLRSLEDPTYGGWGGRFGVVSDTLWKNTVLDFNPYSNRYEAEYSLVRWFNDIQNDFAARADWCISKTYEEANHNPIVSVEEGIDLSAFAGEEITLHAKAEDPDGDIVSFKWWHYAEADTYEESKVKKNEEKVEDIDGLQISINRELAQDEIVDNIVLDGADTEKLTFTVPEDAKVGDTIHIILEGIDDGKFNLKSYQRVIITVK